MTFFGVVFVTSGSSGAGISLLGLTLTVPARYSILSKSSTGTGGFMASVSGCGWARALLSVVMVACAATMNSLNLSTPVLGAAGS